LQGAPGFECFAKHFFAPGPGGERLQMAGKDKILIADDMETFLRLEKMLLERSGYEILMAKSGPEAIKKIQSEKPSLVFLDLLMPEMNGDVVCRFVKSNKALKHIPVIMVTTKSDDESRERCTQAGCEDYITKPVTQRDLFDKINKFLSVDRRRAARALLRVEATATGESLSFSDFTYDVSEGGVFVETDSPLATGTEVDLVFSLSEDEGPIRAKGRVVHVPSPEKLPRGRRPGMGIQFLNVAPRDVARIREYVAHSK